MNYPRAAIRRLAMHFPAVVLVTLPAFSAETPPTPKLPTRAEVERAAAEKPAPPADDAGEPQILSPFVVNSERDRGYQSRSTLAGNRLVSDIRDVGAAISVYTKEFLNDLGAVNSTDILIYAPGMDAAGPMGNYSGATGDINSTNVLSQVRQSSQTARTRGLASPNYTRGFFPSRISIDSYNTGAVTVSRGPNAVLFGAGSPAGVVDTALLLSDLRKNEARIDVRFGDNGALRSVLDVNRVLVPGKLAARLIGLRDREEYDQRPAYDYKQRLYGTLTAKPFRSTTIRGNFETGRNRNSSPQTVLPWDNITPWLAAGKPVWDASFYDDPARHPNASTVSSGATGATNSVTLNPAFGLNSLININQVTNQIAIIFSRPDARVPDMSFRAQLPGVNLGATGANALRNNLFHPLVNRDNANTAPGAGANTGDMWTFMATRNLQQMPLSYWQGVTPGATFIPPGLKSQGFTDYRYFDYRRQMLDTTYGQTSSFHSFDVALEQLAWRDRLGVELVFNRQRADGDTKSFFIGTANANYVQIDTAVMLPTGRPNPNVGRPFMNSRSAYSRSYVEADNLRATAFARYDFRDLKRELGKWLGRHTLTGLAQESSTDSVSYQYRLRSAGAAADSITTSPLDSSDLIPAVISYIGDSFLGPGPHRFQQVTIPQVVKGLQTTTTYFAVPAGSTGQGDFTTALTTLDEVNATGTASREMLKSQAVALQSHWLGDHLVTTLGWRRDKNYLATQTLNNAITEAPLPAGHFFSRTPARNQVHYGFDDFAFPSTPEFRIGKEIKSWSAVLRWPRRLLRLPWGADPSVFYNDSRNFTPAGTRINPYNEPLAPPTGRTREYGLNFALLGDRFFVRLNRYETAVTGQGIDNLAQRNLFINGINQRFATWSLEGNTNRTVDDPRFAQAAAADIATLLSPLPANWRDLYDLRSSGTAPNITSSFRAGQIAGTTDTTDYTARGTEVELTFNPSRQWRFLANVARQKTVQTNIAPGTIEFVNRMKPALDRLASRPSGNYPITNADGTPHLWGQPLPAATQTFGQFLETNVYVPLATQRATEGSASAELPKWRANFVGTYTFANDGRLRGWSLGTGVRWQSRYAIGYPVTRADANAPVEVDVANPFWESDQLNVDGWLAYQRKIWRGKVGWKAQLNVRNLIGGEDMLPITVQPWGAPAVSRLPAEKRWYVTNSFTF